MNVRVLIDKMASKSDPVPEKTSDSNCNVDDLIDKMENMMQSVKEKPASVLALSKLLSCDICKSFLRAPIRNCGKFHKVCYICSSEAGADKNCPAEGCTASLMPKILNSYADLADTVRVMGLPVQCKNRKNGCSEKGEEEEVKKHEVECDFRFVKQWFAGPEKMLFRELKDKVEEIFTGKWEFSYCMEGEQEMTCGAYKILREPDGHMFFIYLDTKDQSLFKASALVIGGEHVADKYRVEIRLSSSEKQITNTHHGPVLSVDVYNEFCGNEEAFYILMVFRY